MSQLEALTSEVQAALRADLPCNQSNLSTAQCQHCENASTYRMSNIGIFCLAQAHELTFLVKITVHRL